MESKNMFLKHKVWKKNGEIHKIHLNTKIHLQLYVNTYTNIHIPVYIMHIQRRTSPKIHIYMHAVYSPM